MKSDKYIVSITISKKADAILRQAGGGNRSRGVLECVEAYASLHAVQTDDKARIEKRVWDAPAAFPDWTEPTASDVREHMPPVSAKQVRVPSGKIVSREEYMAKRVWPLEWRRVRARQAEGRDPGYSPLLPPRAGRTPMPDDVENGASDDDFLAID